MDKQAFVKEIEKLEIAYNKKFSSDELKLWFEEFMTTDIKEFEKAIKKAINELVFTPKIADIRARITVNPNDYYVNDPYAYLYKNLQWCKIIK